MTIEQIDRQDPDFLKHVYHIRKEVFEKEYNFPEEDQMTQNKWDGLSSHYLLIDGGHPVGTISVVDWTGLTDILTMNGIDPCQSVAKITKLALLKESRNLKNLNKLLLPVYQEVSKYDFITANVARPSNQPQDRRMDHIKQNYQKIFGLHEIQGQNGSWILGRSLL